MKVLSNQKGFSMIEITMATLVMALITVYITGKVQDSRARGNDILARSVISDIQSAAVSCENLYNRSLSTDATQEVVKCGDSSLLSLPSGMKADIELGAAPNSDRWARIAVRHNEGTEGATASDRTTFCVARNLTSGEVSDVGVGSTSSSTNLDASTQNTVCPAPL